MALIVRKGRDEIMKFRTLIAAAASISLMTTHGLIIADSRHHATPGEPNVFVELDKQQFEQAQQGLSNALSRLLVVVERYPDLKSNQSFLELQWQREGTENRIAVERQRFNEKAGEYNTAIRRFPANLVAGMSGFEQRPYFQGQAGSDQAPEVNFDFGGGTTAAPSATAPATAPATPATTTTP